MIPLTNLHSPRFRVLEQIRTTLLNLQSDMRANAATHRAMAVAQSPDFSTVKSFIDDCVALYLRNLQWLIDLRADATRRQRLLDALTAYGWAETDLTDVATALRNAVVSLRDAPRTSYAEIIASCDAVTALVNAPPPPLINDPVSLWPEPK